MQAGSSPTMQASGKLCAQALAVIAHRGCVHGPDVHRENTLEAIRSATAEGFSVEFDVRISTDGRLVLAHDAAAWSPARDPYPFLRNPGGPACHALNVKSLLAIPAILNALRSAGTAKSFSLFDFELLTNDRDGCRFLMRSLQDEGFRVAYRLSDREPYLDAYLGDSAIREVWLDEFEDWWVTRSVVRALKDRGVACYYVSPELHRVRNLHTLRARWCDLADWGVDAICTDYPSELAKLVGGAS